MKLLGLAVLVIAVTAANAGLHAGIVAGVGSPAVITGPSGAVIRSGVAHGGIYGAGAVIAPAVAAGYIAGAGIYGAGHGLVGSGIEGQYIHDYTETLYDDGSYKPYLYGH